ncbi:MAG: cupin domain-containing protein [Chitinophagaceae bacterium]
MEIKKIFEGNSFKIVSVTLNKGESMPKHKATSDAFVIVKQGKGKIIFDDKEIELEQDSTQLIPANENHTLEVMEDFSACIVFPIEGEIEFIK